MPKHKKSSKNYKKKSRESSSKKVKVVNVTTSDQAKKISKKLENEKSACVIYLMEGCPHCVTLKETLHHEVEPALKTRMGNMIVKIHNDLMDNLNIENKNVEGFPTITIVKHGKQTKEHNGERNLEALLEFLAKSNVINDVAMAGGAKRKTRKLRKKKTLTKKVRRCCRSCKTCSKCSCKCKKPCKSCKCNCKCKTHKSRKTKRRKHKGGRHADNEPAVNEHADNLLHVKMVVDFNNNNDAIAAFNNDNAENMIEHYFKYYFIDTYQYSDPILINSINYVPNNHSITFLVQKDFKDKILGLDAEDIGLANDAKLFFKNFVSYVLQDPRNGPFNFTDNNNIDHEVSFYPYRPDRIEVNEVN